MRVGPRRIAFVCVAANFDLCLGNTSSPDCRRSSVRRLREARRRYAKAKLSRLLWLGQLERCRRRRASRPFLIFRLAVQRAFSNECRSIHSARKRLPARLTCKNAIDHYFFAFLSFFPVMFTVLFFVFFLDLRLRRADL